MLLPAIQYGPWKIVKARMRKAITKLKRGAPFNEVMLADGLIDTEMHEGLLVVAGTVQGIADNFHCFMPWREAWEPLFDLRTERGKPSAVETEVFNASLNTTWGTLGLLAPDSQKWLLTRETHEPFLLAALAAWQELDEVGPRYFSSVQPKHLWRVPNNLRFILANMGVPGDVLRAPLPPEGPAALLRYAKTSD